jgi:hypothetical protein
VILFVDILHHYQMPAVRVDGGFCRVRIYGANPYTIIVLSELAENPGVSVTNAAAAIATEIARIYMIDLDTTIWIEHYGAFSYKGGDCDETFDRITFTWRNRTASNAEWKRLTADELHELLPDGVEA